MGYSEYKDPFEKTLVIDSSKLKEHCDSLAEILNYYRSLLPVKSDVVVAENAKQQNACIKRPQSKVSNSFKLWFVYLTYWEHAVSKPVGYVISTVGGHAISQEIYEYALAEYGPGAVGTMKTYCSAALAMMVEDGMLERISNYKYVVLKSNASNGNR